MGPSFAMRATFFVTVSSMACAAFRGWSAPLSSAASAVSKAASKVKAAVAAEPETEPEGAAAGCLNPAQALGPNLALLSENQQALVGTLLELSQEHLFADWPAPGEEDDGKLSLLAQLEAVDASYPGGLQSYILKARALLESSAAGDNPFEGYTPSVPLGEDLLYGDDEYREMEALGMAEVDKLGLVLVAGGLGERLGFSGIKVALPVELTTETSFLGKLSLLEQRSPSPGVKVPLVIMTSGDTDAPTRSLLEAEDYFGLERSQVTVLMQDKVPALNDNLGRLVVKGKWGLETKPHGHGDVHHLLHRSGVAKQWADQGKEWVFFFQDTNPLVTHALVPMLGVSVDRKYDMNSLCVPRRAGEAAGGIAKLTHEDGHSLVINVEYNQLDPLLRATPGFEAGDTDDPLTNFSPFPGNVNNLLVYLPNYVKVVSGPDAGVVEEFVNPKYADASRTTFKKPTRLECMMQDLPKLITKELGDDARVGFTTMERWLSFSPAKNDPASGAASAAKGDPPGSPASAEADYYAAFRTTLSKVSGVEFGVGVTKEFAGMPVRLTPAVQLDPAFAATSTELADKVRGGTVSGSSCLVVSGQGVVSLTGLALDGALVLRATGQATLAVQGLVVKNKGWEFVPAEQEEGGEEVPETLRIRGFKLVKHETMEIVVGPEPGHWIVGPDGKPTKQEEE